MSWKDLLQKEKETVILPWIGGRSLSLDQRVWHLEDSLPNEFGWYSFSIFGRKAKLNKKEDPNQESLKYTVKGYLIGNYLLQDDVRVDPIPSEIIKKAQRVFLLESGLDRFARVEAGRVSETSPLIFKSQEMPCGPEEEVLQAFLDDKVSIGDIKNVSPALDATFKIEVWRKQEAIKRRAELERLRLEEEIKQKREEELQKLRGSLGDAVSRRAMARVDFESAARAALRIGGAEYIDHRPSHDRNEMIVRFRLNRQRFECVCDKNTLQITDAGICLTDSETGEKGDSLLSLESLPSTILFAIRENVLHIFRHV